MAGTGAITAQIVNVQTGQPIDGATVKLGGPTTAEQTTGSDGKFKFADLAPANNYTLDVSATGFRTENYEDIVTLDGIVTNLYKLMLWPA